MSRLASGRLLAQLPLAFIPELVPASRLPFRCLRPFSNAPRRKADEHDSKPPAAEPRPANPTFPPNSISPIPRSRPSNPPPSPSLNPKASSGGSMMDLASKFSRYSQMIDGNQQSRDARARRRGTLLDTYRISSDGNFDGNLIPEEKDFRERAHQLHIYATRHNVHITLARPPGWLNKVNGKVSKDRTVAMSVSAGNLGFRHSARKHYDSAFQLASYVMGILRDRGITAEIEQLEVFFRGFGAGREALTRALLGQEGRYLRGKIIKVSDATRLKFGGTRSKKPRRLG